MCNIAYGVEKRKIGGDMWLESQKLDFKITRMSYRYMPWQQINCAKVNLIAHLPGTGQRSQIDHLGWWSTEGEPQEILIEGGFDLIHNDDHCVWVITIVKTHVGLTDNLTSFTLCDISTPVRKTFNFRCYAWSAVKPPDTHLTKLKILFMDLFGHRTDFPWSSMAEWFPKAVFIRW